jgi:hypothetical protein
MRSSITGLVPRILPAAALLAVAACGAGAPSARPALEPAGQPDGCVAPPAGLLAWYRFDEAGWHTAADHPNAAPASPLRLYGAGGGTGRVLGGLELAGGIAYARGAADKNVGTDDFSIAFWLRLHGGPDNRFRSLLDKRDERPIRGYHLAMHGDQPVLQMADGRGYGYFNYHAGIPPGLMDGEWHHLAVTVRRASPAGVRWYVDGRAAGVAGNATYHTGSLDSRAPLLVGSQSFSGPTLIGGAVDELMILTRVLTPAEVSALYTRHACRQARRSPGTSTGSTG